MNNNEISCLLNESVAPLSSSVLKFTNLATASKVGRFHQSISGYKPTPLVNISQLARRLDVKNIFVKDESLRFDINAFKVVGASYAIAEHLAEVLGL
jgi:diaminopropionate ammonia-lyase